MKQYPHRPWDHSLASMLSAHCSTHPSTGLAGSCRWEAGCTGCSLTGDSNMTGLHFELTRWNASTVCLAGPATRVATTHERRIKMIRPAGQHGIARQFELTRDGPRQIHSGRTAFAFPYIPSAGVKRHAGFGQIFRTSWGPAAHSPWLLKCWGRRVHRLHLPPLWRPSAVVWPIS